MRLEVLRVYGGSDEWCVTVDGTYVVGFAGPEARDRALQHHDELEVLLTSAAGPAPGEPANPDLLPPADAVPARFSRP